MSTSGILKIKENGQWTSLPAIKGKDGITFIPSISSSGVLSWTNDGGLENPPSVALNLSGNSTTLALLIGSTNDITPRDALEAIREGKAVILSYDTGTETLFFTDFNDIRGGNEIVSISIKHDPQGYMLYDMYGQSFSNEWIIESHHLITSDTPVLEISKGGTGQASIEDTIYTTPRYRASALVSTETNPTTNGVINWVYE